MSNNKIIGLANIGERTCLVLVLRRCAKISLRDDAAHGNGLETMQLGEIMQDTRST